MLSLDILPGDRSYTIYFGKNIIGRLSKSVASLCINARAAVISDNNVWPLYGGLLTGALSSHGVRVDKILLSPGENSKSIDALSGVFSRLYTLGIKRSDPIIALGGGVIGDLAGFAAASYMRGVPFIQIPTTLLAQVDSSVGGKVAVNLPEGKNLVGSFYQPKLVIADTSTLNTLPGRELAAGMAEVVKYAAIDTGGLAELLSEPKAAENAPEEIIRLCCQVKAAYVQKDEYDTGVRRMLNFGHTFAHAIERFYGFKKYNHGEAVAIGMAMAARVGELLGISTPGTQKRLMDIMDAQKISYTCDAKPSELIDLMLMDKKNTGDNIALVLLKSMGKPFIYEISANELKRVMSI